EHRAQKIDQREEMLLAVLRAEQAEDISADGVEEADQRKRARRDPRRDAADHEVRRQVRGEEDELEAAREERERHEDVAAVAHRLAQRIAELPLRLRGNTAGRWFLTDGE